MNKNKILRFITAGSVDDGKSTLIGRLLYDSKSIFQDQIQSVEKTSKKKGFKSIDLALFTDGLKDEREQGITIDVAYRYFSTPKRKFIIADTPGHIQYTRNMVTGASTANLAIILVDARNGVIEQTKRHSYIVSMLGIKHIVVCINKMDLVDYDKGVFDKIVEQYKALNINVDDIKYIPTSAFEGDNIVSKSTNMSWYKDEALLEFLENVKVLDDVNIVDFRFPVQTVIRPEVKEFPDYRAYAGKIASGEIKIGDEVVVIPSNQASTIKEINTEKGKLKKANAGESISILLNDNIDVNRGDMIVKKDNIPNITNQIKAIICWFNDNEAKPRAKYILRHTTNEQKAIITNVLTKIDINTFDKNTDDKSIKMNDICQVEIKLSKAIAVDKYSNNITCGSFILVDSDTYETVAAGMIY